MAKNKKVAAEPEVENAEAAEEQDQPTVGKLSANQRKKINRAVEAGLASFNTKIAYYADNKIPEDELYDQLQNILRDLHILRGILNP